MSFITQKINEGVAIPEAGIAPVSAGTGTTNTLGVDMSRFARVRFNLMTGVLGSSATVDMKLKQSAASNLGSATDITNAAITQIVKASGDGKIACIELKPEMMTAGQRYAFAAVTVGTAASLLAVFVEGVPSQAKPANQFNSAVVVQQVSVP